MADPNTTLTGCSGSNYRFGTVPFARYLCFLRLDKAVLRTTLDHRGNFNLVDYSEEVLNEYGIH